MKSIFLIVIVFYFTSTSFSQSGWIYQNSNVSKNLNDVFFVNAQTGWVVGDSSRLLKTTDGGLNWSNQTMPIYTPLKTVFFLNEKTGWAAGGFFYFAHSGAIYKTTNGGNNWAYSFSGVVTDIYFANENTGFISLDGSGDFGSQGGIAKTTNKGINWTTSYAGYLIHSLSFKDSIGWACGYYGDDTGHDTNLIMKTTNYGNSWDVKFKQSNGFNWSSQFKQIFCLNNNLWVVGTDSSVLRSSDGGENWNKIILNTPGRFNSVFFANINTGWIAGNTFFSSPGNILKSTNGGINWFIQSNAYNEGLSSVFFIDEYTGWTIGGNYTTGNGLILKTITGGITSVNHSESSLPSEFKLYQNYPNPFNPQTVISYRIKFKSFIELKIFNVLGINVATLVNKYQNEGNYDIPFYAGSLSSGIYYYSLYANGESKGIRMMALIK